jgi:radical SAM superfamily enzyme YgiQ (UPF0313 family)
VTDKKHTYAPSLLIGQEKGFAPSVHKPVSMLLIYPNTYYVGMSNLGFQAIYYHANQHPSIFCDRGFVYKSRPVSGILSGISLRSFDIAAFSASFELDYFNIVSALRESGLNPDRTQRKDTDPLILIGGIAPTINPLPLAGIADAIVIGDGEMVLNDLLNACIQGKTRSGRDVLDSLSVLSGVFVPETHNRTNPVMRLQALDLDLFPAQTHVFTAETEFSGRFLIEVGRGCGRKCRFCAADYIYPRPRWRSAESIISAISWNRQFTDKVGMLGVAVMNHPDIDDIIRQVQSWNMDISISSLRVEAIKESVLDMITASGQRSVTLAPETGSDRLRKTINKRFTNDRLLSLVQTLQDVGVQELKLYFMAGLPGETDADIEAIISLCKDISARNIRLKVNVNPFIPKPHTPFEREPMMPQKELKRVFSYLQSEFRAIPRSSFSHASIREAYTEALICRADENMGNEILLNASVRVPKELAGLAPDAPLPWKIVHIPLS